MLISVPVLLIGWFVYWLWDKKMTEIEKSRPKPVSQRLQKTKNEVSDWAKKMAEFQPPKKKTPSEPNQQQDKPE